MKRVRAWLWLSLWVCVVGCEPGAEEPVIVVGEAPTLVRLLFEVPPEIEGVEQIMLHLTCDDGPIDQQHAIPLADSARVSFGGLPFGMCTIVAYTVGPDGAPSCSGQETFTVQEGLNEVQVPLTCYVDPVYLGAAEIRITVKTELCPDRIRKLWAIPGRLRLDEGGAIQVETTEVAGGQPVYEFASSNLSALQLDTDCEVESDNGASACIALKCLAGDGEWVDVDVRVRVQDAADPCFDSELIRIRCMRQP